MIAAGTRLSEGLRPTLILFPLVTASLIYWIWIMVMGIKLNYPCPERCMCDTEAREIDCSDAGLQNIPENKLGELDQLILNGNNYSVLRKGMFQKQAYTHIEYLSFAECNVSVIETGAFDHISVRYLLALEENNLTDIPSGVFHNLTALQNLDMSSNNIEVIRSKVFDGLESLEKLHLQNNFIRYFEKYAFWGLFNLIALDLSSNKIIHMQSGLFSKMPRLKYLKLSRNMIDIPSHTVFLNSDTIYSILLDGCGITQLSVNTFRNMPSLWGIGLQDNRLTYVNTNTFSMLPNIFAVLLNDNPLICDCNLKITYNWFAEHNIHTGNFIARCNEPSEVNGLGWGVVGSGECEDMVIKYIEDVTSISLEYINWMVENDGYGYLIKYSRLVQLLMFVFGTVGNVIIILIILCNKELRTIPNMYILNLAIGDLMILISGSPVYEMIPLEILKYLCWLYFFLIRLSRGVTAYTIAILSIQRYEVIVRPFLSRIKNINPRRTLALHVSIVWILASLFTLTGIYFDDFYYERECIARNNTYSKKVDIFELVVYCILPLCVIGTMYFLTASHLIRSKAVASEEIPQHQRQAKSRATTVKTILSLTLVFAITYMPLQTIRVYIWVNGNYDNIEILNYWESIALCLNLTNACFNPVSLFYASSSFRKCLKSFLCDRCKKGSTQPAEPAVRVITTNL